MSERPAWAPTCTCGETPDGYFCHGCNAWVNASFGEQGRHTTAQRINAASALIRDTPAPRGGDATYVRSSEALGD